MDIDSIRKLHPHLQNGVVHLNHAGISPLPTPTADAMRKYIDLMNVDAGAGGLFGFPLWNACRDKLAALMNVSAEDVALTKNTAHGLSIVADGLKWRDGDEIVFADCEYPSNTFPWMAQQDRGVVCRIVPTRSNGSLSADDYRAVMSRKTRVLAVSWVQFSTGWRCDLVALANLAHEFGALFVVDIIQGLGAVALDVPACGIDIAATGSQKWLMGPCGVGGLFIHKNVIEQLRLVNMGALSVKNAMAFEPLAFEPRDTAQRYEEGTPNIPGAVGLAASIDLLESVGASKIQQHVLSITRYAMESLRARGYTILSPDADEHRAGIVLFRHPTLPNQIIMDALAAAKVNAVERGGKIRFAPHYYNTPDDIDRVLTAMP